MRADTPLAVSRKSGSSCSRQFNCCDSHRPGAMPSRELNPDMTAEAGKSACAGRSQLRQTVMALS
jgi:hypothetical protein